MKRIALLALVAFAAVAPAQGPEPARADEAAVAAARLQVRRLSAPDPAQIEDARRTLCMAPRAALPVEELLDVARNADEQPAFAAVDVLLRHGLATAELRQLALEGRRPARVRERLFEVLPASTLLREGRRGLLVLQRRGELSDEALQAALLHPMDSELAATAALILVAQRTPLPLPVLQAASGDADARRRLLDALGERPRAAAAPWLTELLARRDLNATDRVAAIAALPAAAITPELARELLQAAANEDVGGVRAAAVRLQASVADKLVPQAHRLLLEGVPLARLLPCFENVSTAGERHLLGLCRTLPAAARAAVVDWLAGRGSSALQGFVAAALDGGEELDAVLLRHASPEVVRPRLARVAAALREPALAEAAFAAMVEAGAWHEDMWRVLRPEADGPIEPTALHRLASLSAGKVPASVLLVLLREVQPAVREAAARIAATHAGAALPQELEAALLTVAGGDQQPRVRAAAARAVAIAGSEAGVRALWQALDDGARAAAVPWFTERPRPWTAALLRDELARVPPDPEQSQPRAEPTLRQELLLGLARLGDGGAATTIAAEALRLPLPFLRRAREAVAPLLDATAAAGLVRDAERTTSDMYRLELVRFVAARPRLSMAALERWQESDDLELRAEARRGLMRTDLAARLRQRLLDAIEAPRALGEEERELAWELLGAMPLPLSAEDADLLARLALVQPLAARLGEAGRSLGPTSRRTAMDYPLLAPIADLLRRDDGPEAAAAFARAAAASLAHRNAHAMSRRRLGHLLVAIADDEPLRDAIGPILAELIVAAPDQSTELLGPAHLLLGERAAREGRHAQAAQHFEEALHRLLHEPLAPPVLRRFVGEQSPSRGTLPMARVAARGWLERARAALAAGDADAARAALANARDLGDGDRQAVQETENLAREIR